MRIFVNTLLAASPQEPTAIKQNLDSNKTQLTSRFPGVAFGTDVQVIGMAESTIGEGSVVQDGTWLNVCIRDGSERLRIGRCACIGRWNFLSSGTFLEIGDYCLFAPNIYVSDADHAFNDPFRPYISQGIRTRGPVVVEENCWLGKGVSVVGSLTIGRGSVIGANSLVLRDVEPFSIVVGSPAKLVKMFDPVEQAWVRIDNPTSLETVRRHRKTNPLPDRETYREILRRNGPDRLDALVAGAGRHV